MKQPLKCSYVDSSVNSSLNECLDFPGQTLFAATANASVSHVSLRRNKPFPSFASNQTDNSGHLLTAICATQQQKPLQNSQISQPTIWASRLESTSTRGKFARLKTETLDASLIMRALWSSR